MKKKALLLMLLVVSAGLGAAAFIFSGVYDVSASKQHMAPTYLLMDIALRRSVRQRSAEIQVPKLDDVEVIGRGQGLFHDHCVQCHGAPGVAPEPFALGLRPSAANLVYTARHWSPAEIYWVMKNGVKMTGMPAWEFRLSEPDLWAVVSFVMQLPKLSPQDYDTMLTTMTKRSESPNTPLPDPDPERGKRALLNYACATCHRIPGVVGPNAPVGPPLDRIGSRAVIAGVLPNEGGAMVRWLRSPQAVSPHSAMPDLGIGEQDANDMAAYLSTLK